MGLSKTELDTLLVNMNRGCEEEEAKMPFHLIKQFAPALNYAKKIAFLMAAEIVKIHDRKRASEIKGLQKQVNTLEIDLLKVRGLLSKYSQPVSNPPVKRRKKNGRK